MKMMILFLSLFCLSVGIGCNGSAVSQVFSIGHLNPSRNSGQTVNLVGTVKIGHETCLDQTFLEDESGAIQVRGEDPNEGTTNVNSSFLGGRVEVVGTYIVQNCLAICLCDPHVAVESITRIEGN